jgi:hypothetical protein
MAAPATVSLPRTVTTTRTKKRPIPVMFIILPLRVFAPQLRGASRRLSTIRRACILTAVNAPQRGGTAHDHRDGGLK